MPGLSSRQGAGDGWECLDDTDRSTVIEAGWRPGHRDVAGLSARWFMVAAMVDIEVRSRVPGTSGDDLPAVLVRLDGDRTTARELIRRAVEEQIRELRADAARCRRVLDRQYLSDDDLRAQAGTGAIRMPRQAPADPDVTAEVSRAHRAFARGTFVVFVGGRQVVDLDEEVALRLGDPVVFLRLVALVGG